jgi:hypothetical protein
MARTSIQYRFTIGKPLNLSKQFFTPLKNEEFPTIALADYYSTSDPTNSYIFTEHQIQFSVNMDNNSKPNSSSITIYNVDEEIKQYIKANKASNIVCILEAGDNEQGLKKVFEGTITRSEFVEDSEVNYVKFSLGDGVVSAKNAKTIRTYPRGTTYEQILKDLNKDMKLPVSTFAGISGDRLLNPVTFAGKSHDILSNISKTLGLDYSIQNNEIVIIPYKRMLKKEVSVITSSTGLIGKVALDNNDTSGVSTSVDKPDKYTIKFTCLLDGSLKPSETVYVKDDEYDSAFKITSVRFEGDYEGNTWFCHVIADKTEGVLDV